MPTVLLVDCRGKLLACFFVDMRETILSWLTIELTMESLKLRSSSDEMAVDETDHGSIGMISPFSSEGVAEVSMTKANALTLLL